LNVAGELFYC